MLRPSCQIWLLRFPCTISRTNSANLQGSLPRFVGAEKGEFEAESAGIAWPVGASVEISVLPTDMSNI